MGSILDAIDWGNAPDHLQTRPGSGRTPTTRRPGGGPPQRPRTQYPNSTPLMDQKRQEMLAATAAHNKPTTLADQLAAAGLPPRDPYNPSIEETARAKYGHLAGFVNHPEIGPILKQAAAENWGEAELYGAVSATGWWKSTSAAQRTWWQLTNEDPAEARRLVNQTAATIQNRARTLGLNIGSGSIGGLATTATQNGWTDAQTVDALIQQVNWATLEAGDLTAMRDNVKAIGSDYLVGVSDTTAQNYAARIASGEMSMEGVKSAMLQQAKARFGWMADQLDGGMTVKDYFRPTRDVIATELGLPPEEVDLTDSKWLKLVEKRDEKTGELRAATLDEAMLAARRDPMFANTAKAKEMTTSMTDMVSNLFGRV